MIWFNENMGIWGSEGKEFIAFFKIYCSPHKIIIKLYPASCLSALFFWMWAYRELYLNKT